MNAGAQPLGLLMLPIYFRSCGPARALMRVNGREIAHREELLPRAPHAGQHAQPDGDWNRLIANKPARPGLGVTFFWAPPSRPWDLVAIRNVARCWS